MPPPGRQKVRAAPGRDEARLPRRAALGRPPVPTHGLGQSLTGGEATDSRRLRQRRGSGSSAGSCRSGRRARSIPAPTTPPPGPPPAPLQPLLPPPPLPRPRRASADQREGTMARARARAPSPPPPTTSVSRGRRMREAAPGGDAHAVGGVAGLRGVATPQARPPTRAQAKWAEELQVARHPAGEFFLSCLEFGNSSTSASWLFGLSACRILGSS